MWTTLLLTINNIPFTACRDASTPEKVAFEVLVPDGSAPKDDFICITIGDKTYFFTPEGDQNGKVNFPSPGAILHLPHRHPGRPRQPLPPPASRSLHPPSHPLIPLKDENTLHIY